MAPMVRKLTKIGDDFGLVIDKAVLELLNIDPEDEVEITTDGVQLIVKAVEKTKTEKPKVSRRPGIPAKRERPEFKEKDHQYGFPKKQPW